MAFPLESYRITFEPDLACIRLAGAVTMPGIIAASEALYGAEAWTFGCSELWDLSAIDSLDVTPESLRAVADFEGDLGDVVGPGRTALVVSREDDYDIGVLYAHLPKDNGRVHRTFWAESAARAWLAETSGPCDSNGAASYRADFRSGPDG